MNDTIIITFVFIVTLIVITNILYIIMTSSSSKLTNTNAQSEPCKLHKWEYVGEGEYERMRCTVCGKTPTDVLNDHIMGKYND